MEAPETVAAAGRLEAAMGDPKSAYDRLLQAQAKNRDNTAVAAALAQIAAGLGKYDVTLEQYRKLEARHPAALEYALGVANSLALLKKTTEAADQYKKVQHMSGSRSASVAELRRHDGRKRRLEAGV